MANDAVGSGRGVEDSHFEDDDEDQMCAHRHSVFAPEANRRVRVPRRKRVTERAVGGRANVGRRRV
jgi:hypothetical protein